MENEVSGEAKQSSSYRYWVRETTDAAAPPPVPRKLSADDLTKQQQPAPLGSVWNHAGTWEERNLNTWATSRIKDLLTSLDSLEFSGGKAGISEVTECSGDAFLVTVRNKKRVGYTYKISLKFKGEWLVKEENKAMKGFIDIHEFSFGELDDLQIEVRLNEEKDLLEDERLRILNDVRLFLPSIRNQLSKFEEELKDR
ncbi:uncharacterized protein LOC116266948 [Nymphaea colorata]|nr:uncharacterized protein LOC116266948 [Nymphaea colorata]XP_031504331.1 uncharacterized protein LOC116266948 [Nymphaea colorata]